VVAGTVVGLKPNDSDVETGSGFTKPVPNGAVVEIVAALNLGGKMSFHKNHDNRL